MKMPFSTKLQYYSIAEEEEEEEEEEEKEEEEGRSSAVQIAIYADWDSSPPTDRAMA